MISLAAAAAGVVHTLAGPDHYLPVITLARAREWRLRTTLATTLLLGVLHCGSGLLLVAALGLTGLTWRGGLAAWLLIATGLVLLGLAWRRANARPATSLLALAFLVGPCEWMVAGAVLDALWFGIGTIATMLVAVAAGAGALARVPLTPRAATAFSGVTCVTCGALLFAGF